MFEADDRIGGHTNTIRVDDPRGDVWVDTGFIVHNDRNYPHFAGPAGRARGRDAAGGDGDVDRLRRRRVRVRQHPARALRPALEPAAAAVLAPDRRPASLQPRGPPARRARRRADGRRVPARLRLLALVHRARDRSRDLGRLVGRPAPAIWDFPLGFLAEFLDNHGQLQLTGRPRWRTIAGGSRAYVERLIAPLRDRIRTGAAVRRIERLGRRGRDRGRRLRDRGLRRGRRRRPLRPGAGDARRPHTSRARRCSERCATSQTRRSCTPTPRLMPRRRRAWASWNFHLADRPGARTAVTYWMNNLQRLDCERDYFVTLNRRERIDPACGDRGDRLRASGDHPRQRRRAAALGRDQRPRPDPLLRRVLALGLSRGRLLERDPRLRRLLESRSLPAASAGSRAARCPPRAGARAGAGRMTASALYEGWVRHRRVDAGRARVPLPDLHGLPRPRRAARGARPAAGLVGAAPGAGVVSALRSPRRSGQAARRVGARRGRRESSATGRAGRSGC